MTDKFSTSVTLAEYFRPLPCLVACLTCGRKMKTCMKFICCRYCTTTQGCKIYGSDLNARQGLSDCTALDEIFLCLPFLKYGTASIVSLSKMWKEVHKKWQIASEQSISLHIPEGGNEKRLTGNVAFLQFVLQQSIHIPCLKNDPCSFRNKRYIHVMH